MTETTNLISEDYICCLIRALDLGEYNDHYNNEWIQEKIKWMPPVKYKAASICAA